MTSILNVLPNFNNLSDDLKTQIKCLYVSLNKQSERHLVLFVTREDQVYGVGDNSYGKLGLGHNNYLNEWTLITQLCGQNICEFFEGFDCIFAKSLQNKLYGWGSNKYGQLATGNCSEWNEYLTAIQLDYFDQKCIVQICCGHRHCLALSSDGLVYGWGLNTWGQVGATKRDKIISTPVLLDSKCRIKHKIKSIHCSDFGSFAITFDNQVYSWGLNFYGDLGHNNYPILGAKCLFHPKLLDIKNIINLSTFNGNTYLLDNQGCIFGCGKNYKGYKLGKCETDTFCDIFGKVLQSNEFVFKISDENLLIKTNYFNIWDYFLNECKTTSKTIHLSNDGSVLVSKIKLNTNFIKYQNDLDNNFLSVEFENIYESKFEKQFNIIRKIGTGSYGSLFEVINKFNDRVFAIKKFQIEELNFKKFSEIINSMPKMNSDFFVKITSSWIERNGVTFIQAEMCLGNLSSILNSKAQAFGRKSNERLDSFEYFISCEILREVTQSLNYLHSLTPPIIHSNLKPENILMTDGRNGRFFKLCDFGLMVTNSCGSVQRGSNQYMAPELCDVTNEISHNQKSDVYSLAIIANKLFEFNIVTNIDECLEKYFNTSLVMKCRLLLQTLTLMASAQPEDRPNCLDLLSTMNKWTIDKIRIVEMQNYKVTLTKLRKCKNNFFINYLERKIIN